MKAHSLKKIVNWTAVAVLFTGIGYAGLALNATPVYASTCNCTEERVDAGEYCFSQGGNGALTYFDCPVGGSAYVFSCVGDPNQTLFGANCD